ncbi:integral membrane protein [Ophiostoma piceae UAMH 11346]|uniref:Integral membrane protein n=1 Tax=Ophiostoma piceae (strain UAMH 11346) TaxID=1262450 RepID=S3C7M4_OPHP1|nr:integral membrane protein [Ophiostoma piceae UAMH 11346]
MPILFLRDTHFYRSIRDWAAYASRFVVPSQDRARRAMICSQSTGGGALLISTARSLSQVCPPRQSVITHPIHCRTERIFALMDSSADGWHAVHPQGLGRALFILTVFFTVFTVIILGMRVYIRTKHKLNSIEDYLMYIGVIINLGHNAVVMYGCYTGIGAHSDRLNMAVSIEGAKPQMVTMWQILYVTSSPFIKISICANLIRIAVQRRYIYPLYAVSILSIAMTVMAFIVVFVQCIPFQASWTGQGKCAAVNVIIIPTYVFSSVNILVDWTVAILPAFILWNLQLRRRLKILCFAILSVGVLASIATIVRMPYVPSYASNDDKLYKLANVILWTVIELSLGIIAGSLPSLRKFFKKLAEDNSSRDDSYGTDLAMRGAKRTKILPGAPYDCELNTIVGPARENSSDGPQDKDDSSSTRRIIYVKRDVVQTVAAVDDH